MAILHGSHAQRILLCGACSRAAAGSNFLKTAPGAIANGALADKTLECVARKVAFQLFLETKLSAFHERVGRRRFFEITESLFLKFFLQLQLFVVVRQTAPNEIDLCASGNCLHPEFRLADFFWCRLLHFYRYCFIHRFLGSCERHGGDQDGQREQSSEEFHRQGRKVPDILACTQQMSSGNDTSVILTLWFRSSVLSFCSGARYFFSALLPVHWSMEPRYFFRSYRSMIIFSSWIIRGFVTFPCGRSVRCSRPMIRNSTSRSRSSASRSIISSAVGVRVCFMPQISSFIV